MWTWYVYLFVSRNIKYLNQLYVDQTDINKRLYQCNPEYSHKTPYYLKNNKYELTIAIPKYENMIKENNFENNSNEIIE